MSPAPAAPPSDAARERLQVMLPPPRLAAGFVCMVVRRVQPHEAGEPLLAPVHANPYACFNVVLRGEVQARGEALPASFLVGPLSQPLQTKVAGELLSLSLVLQPWLLAPLFAIRAADLRDRIVPADDHSLMARWTAPARDALATGEFAGFWQLLASQQPQVTPPDLALGVLQHSGVAAAAAATGCSERQYRRRFHNSMGTAPATWLRHARWEAALRGMARSGAAGGLADLAAGSGYADQAHLARETRSLAGDSPARLRQQLARGAAPWSLQPARVRSVQDAG